MDNNGMIIFRKNIELLGQADKAIYYFREQQYDKALAIVVETIDIINHIVEIIIKDHQFYKIVSTESLLEMLTEILEAKKNQDYILLADLYEMKLLRFFCNVQEMIMNRDEYFFDEDSYETNMKILSKTNTSLLNSIQVPIDPVNLMNQSYRVEFSACGLMTLGAENEGDKFYFHTNNRITAEAFLLAKRWYNENKQKYIIYGLGFGYHVMELRKLAPTAKIEVYESDCNILQLACAFTDMKPLLMDKSITIIYDPTYEWLKERLQNIKHSDTFEIHFPSLKNVRDKKIKKILESYLPWSKILEVC